MRALGKMEYAQENRKIARFKFLPKFVLYFSKEKKFQFRSMCVFRRVRRPSEKLT